MSEQVNQAKQAKPEAELGEFAQFEAAIERGDQAGALKFNEGFAKEFWYLWWLREQCVTSVRGDDLKGFGDKVAGEADEAWREAEAKATPEDREWVVFYLRSIQPREESEPQSASAVEEAKAPEREELDPRKALVPIPVREWVAEIDLPQTMSGAECIERVNLKHAVIGNYGQRTAVLSWERWAIDSRVLIPTFQKFDDFKRRYLNQYVSVVGVNNTRHVSVGEYWLKSPERGVSFNGIVFEPGRPQIVEGYRLNVWRGFAVTARRGSWRKFLRHIYRVLGNGDRAAGRYILRWCAWAIQNPGRAAEAVLVLKGEEGAGKGTLARALLRIFGVHGLPVSDSKHLTGAFSGHLQFCAFLFLDEAFWAGDAQHEGRLKALVTEETISIEPKYFTPFSVTNCLHILMASNSEWVVPAGQRARRYSVMEVSDARVGDFEYFEDLHEELDNGGIEAFLWDMLHMDLRGWHPKQIYKSSALQGQKRQSLRGLDAWMEAILQDGQLPVPLSKQYPNRCLSENLLASAQRYDKYTNKTKVADYLKAHMGVTPFNVKILRGWAFPDLPECRARWEKRFDGEWEWHMRIGDWSGEVVDLMSRRVV
jgi:hypothetical protein